MFWRTIVVIGCLACLFAMIIVLRKTFQENSNDLSEYDFHITNGKVMIPLILGIGMPQFLYFSEGIIPWFSISVLIVFLTVFLIIVYSNRRTVKKNNKEKPL